MITSLSEKNSANKLVLYQLANNINIETFSR